MARLVRHRQPKGPATDRPHLNHRATSRLYNLISVAVGHQLTAISQSGATAARTSSAPRTSPPSSPNEVTEMCAAFKIQNSRRPATMLRAITHPWRTNERWKAARSFAPPAMDFVPPPGRNSNLFASPPLTNRWPANDLRSRTEAKSNEFRPTEKKKKISPRRTARFSLATALSITAPLMIPVGGVSDADPRGQRPLPQHVSCARTIRSLRRS